MMDRKSRDHAEERVRNTSGCSVSVPEGLLFYLPRLASQFLA